MPSKINGSVMYKSPTTLIGWLDLAFSAVILLGMISVFAYGIVSILVLLSRIAY